MNNRTVPGERIAAARAALDNVRTLLLKPSPRTVDECVAPLTEAVESIRHWREAEPGRVAADELKRDLDEVRLLLEQAGACYLDWARLLNRMTGSYDSGGALRAPAGATVSVEG